MKTHFRISFLLPKIFLRSLNANCGGKKLASKPPERKSLLLKGIDFGNVKKKSFGQSQPKKFSFFLIFNFQPIFD